VSEHEHAHGLQRGRPLPALVGQHAVEEGRIRGVEHRPVAAVDAQFERLVPLQHQARPGPAAGGQHGGDLSPAQGQVALEALEVRCLVPEGTVRQAEKDLAVHLGEAAQPEPPEQVVGVVDGAVVGADDVPRADRVVVSVDPLVAAGAPAGGGRAWVPVGAGGDVVVSPTANAAVLVWIAGVSDGLHLLPANRRRPPGPLYIEGRARVVGRSAPAA